MASKRISRNPQVIFEVHGQKLHVHVMAGSCRIIKLLHVHVHAYTLIGLKAPTNTKISGLTRPNQGKAKKSGSHEQKGKWISYSDSRFSVVFVKV